MFCFTKTADWSYYYSENRQNYNTSLTRDIEILESDKLEKGYKISFLSYEDIVHSVQGHHGFLITLMAKNNDQSQPIVAARNIKINEVLKGKTVRYTGKLFEDGGFDPEGDPTYDAPFTITIDDEWGEIIENPI
jgi:hypothetical protein